MPSARHHRSACTTWDFLGVVNVKCGAGGALIGHQGTGEEARNQYFVVRFKGSFRVYSSERVIGVVVLVSLVSYRSEIKARYEVIR